MFYDFLNAGLIIWLGIIRLYYFLKLFLGIAKIRIDMDF